MLTQQLGTQADIMYRFRRSVSSGKGTWNDQNVPVFTCQNFAEL